MPVGPSRYESRSLTPLSARARFVRVFFSTMNSTLASRSLRRILVTTSTFIPLKAVKTIDFDREMASVSSRTRCSFSVVGMGREISFVKRDSKRLGLERSLDRGRVETDRRAHRRAERHATDVLTLGGGRPGAHHLAQERLHVREELVRPERGLPDRRVQVAGLVHPVFDLAPLHLADRFRDVEGDRSAAGIGHEPPRPQDAAQLADL